MAIIKILYVEDDPESAEVLRLLLHSDECEVYVAETIVKGLELAKTENFHLYILDNWLPDGTGIELCEKIRQFDSHTPIVFFTAVGSRALIKRALDAGAQSYLIKSLGLEQLKEIVARLLAGRQAEES